METKRPFLKLVFRYTNFVFHSNFKKSEPEELKLKQFYEYDMYHLIFCYSVLRGTV